MSDFEADATVLDFDAEQTLASGPSGMFDPLAPGAVVGEYRIRRKIAEGGMAEVFEAEHPVIGKRVAIKVLTAAQCGDPSGVERFLQEARAVNRIAHPNIVDVFSFGELADGRSYMVMEWLPGRTLAQRIATGPMPIDEVVEILDQLADALQAAHAKQIAHRDLKPENVFLVETESGHKVAKLLDFGIAKLLDISSTRHTRDGMCVGTPGYMSPEQARGLELDARTDIYSLGVLGFEMVTGHLPFRGASAMDIMVKQLSSEPMPPSVHRQGIPSSLNSVLRRMIERDRQYRPTLAEIRTTLAKLQAASVRGHTLAMSLVPAQVIEPPVPRFLAVGTQPQPMPADAFAVEPPAQTPERRDQCATGEATVETTVGSVVERPAWKQVVAIAIAVVVLVLFAAIVTNAVRRHVKSEPTDGAAVSLLERQPGGEPLIE